MAIDSQVWTIRNATTNCLYWSNQWGWTKDKSEASYFSDTEKQHVINLPIGGEWVNVLADKPRTLSAEQREALIALLWDNLKKVPAYQDRRQLGGGHCSKTKAGLLATIENIVYRG